MNQLVPDDTPVAMRQATQPHQRRIIKSTGDGEGGPGSVKSEPNSSADASQNKQYLGTPHDAIPQIDLSVENKSLPKGVTMDDVNNFENMYKEHCEVRQIN